MHKAQWATLRSVEYITKKQIWVLAVQTFIMQKFECRIRGLVLGARILSAHIVLTKQLNIHDLVHHKEMEKSLQFSPNILSIYSTIFLSTAL